MLIKRKYFENLDASRFFAFIIVFLAHAFIANSEDVKNNDFFQHAYNWGKLGILGLEYFFVLSSFLITWTILEEKHFTKNFDIKGFLIRRTLRIWPLYFLIVLLGFSIAYISFSLNYNINEIPSFYNFAFFIVNFDMITHGGNFLIFLTFLWSISIEEQFYLFYAIIVKYIKANLQYVAFLLIISSLIFRYINIENYNSLYLHTVSAFGNFGIGILTAYIAFNKTSLFIHLSKFSKLFNVVFYLTLFFSIIFYHQLKSVEFFTVISRIYFSILFAYYIIEQSFGENRLFNPGKNKLLNHFGKISYGLYCYHGVVITFIIKALDFASFKDTIYHSFILYPVLILTLTFAISHISFIYFENYFLKLKSKFYTFANNE